MISRNFFISRKYFRILDRLGFNFYSINLNPAFTKNGGGRCGGKE